MKSYPTYISRIILCGILFCASTSCEFLDVEDPKSSVPNDKVFSNDVTATAALTGIYNDLMDASGFASGSNISVTTLAGLSADELIDFARQDNTNIEFEENRLLSQNSNVFSLWNSMYKTIYQTNAVIEGVENSPGLSTTVKNQLMGEALLIRSLANFYLINLFGDVPLILTTNYEKNAVATRVDKQQVYNQILSDLNQSIELMADDYTAMDDSSTNSRARANKYAAIALLARVHLYLGNWAAASDAASKVIAATDKYQLATNLDEVFLKNSSEAIWQIQPITPDANGATNEAFCFVNFYSYNILNPTIVDAFESGDQRAASWIGAGENDGGETVYFPYKYKQADPSAQMTEYSMVIRLAEMYLIRSEARAHGGDLPGATEDLDAIRMRVGLPGIADVVSVIDQATLINAIEHERQVELFCEWGHRWLDLKRTNRTEAVLSPIKGSWDRRDELYPLPQAEFDKNKSLGLQNPGYL